MKKVLVVGDAMLDVTEEVRVLRLSQEVDHVPVLRRERLSYNPGGAANVAVGVHAMGAPHLFFGMTTVDANGDILGRQLTRGGVHHIIDHWQGGCTTTKHRIVTPSGMIARLDFDDPGCIPINYWSWDNPLLKAFKTEIAAGPAVVVLVNYDKRFLEDTVITKLISATGVALDSPVILVDPGHKGDWSVYAGCNTVFKVNVAQTVQQYEFSKAAGVPGLLYPLYSQERFHSNVVMGLAALLWIGRRVRHNLLHAKIQFRYAIVTCGASGMVMFSSKSDAIYPVLGEPVEVRDVCGAGDTALAALAAELAGDQSVTYDNMVETVKFADAAARTAVQIRGVAVVNRAMVKRIPQYT